MKRQAYIKPAISEVKIEQTQMICISVMNPGEPNTPAGASCFEGNEDDNEECW